MRLSRSGGRRRFQAFCLMPRSGGFSTIFLHDPFFFVCYFVRSLSEESRSAVQARTGQTDALPGLGERHRDRQRFERVICRKSAREKFPEMSLTATGPPLTHRPEFSLFSACNCSRDALTIIFGLVTETVAARDRSRLELRDRTLDTRRCMQVPKRWQARLARSV